MCEASNEMGHSTTRSYLGIVAAIRCGALQAASGATLRSGGSGAGAANMSKAPGAAGKHTQRCRYVCRVDL